MFKSTTSSTKVLLSLLKKQYPDAKCALVFKNPEELLIATILSAQCTDLMVNKVTAKLFKKYPHMSALANASLPELEVDIRPTGFYKNKAKNIKKCAETLVKVNGGKVPEEMGQLVELPGVGRKTANVVLGNAFQIASGIVVDTHVARLSQRMNFTNQKDPVKIEKDLIDIVPRKDWIQFSHWLILHGRQFCKARKPNCSGCPLDGVCPKRI